MKIEEQILAQNDIVDIISSYIDLKRKGKNYFGVCPFHEDTNPSMSVSPQKQIYKCFSCGAGGDLITFVKEFEHLTYPQTIEKLAKLSNLEYKSSTVATKKLTVFDEAVKFYHYSLTHGAQQTAKQYLESRSINDELIKSFDLGYASLENGSLLEYLNTKFTREEIIASRLFDENLDREFFHDRLIFPIRNHQGQVVAFSGRTLANHSSKYMNSSMSDLFNKSEVLYNYHQIDKKKEYVFITEGFFDVIRLCSIDVANAVATMGTALTAQHVDSLKHFKKVYLVFDGDEAGKKASLNAFMMLKDVVKEVYYIPLSNNEDIDTYILENGKDDFMFKVKSSGLFADMYALSLLKEGFDRSSDKLVSTLQMLKAYVSEDINEQITLLLSEEFINADIVVDDLSSINLIMFNMFADDYRILEALELDVLNAMFHSVDAVEFFLSDIKVLDNLYFNFIADAIVLYHENFKELDLISYVDLDSSLNLDQLDVYMKLVEKPVLYSDIMAVMKDYNYRLKEYKATLQIKKINVLLKNEQDSELKKKYLKELSKAVSIRNEINISRRSDYEKN